MTAGKLEARLWAELPSVAVKTGPQWPWVEQMESFPSEEHFTGHCQFIVWPVEWFGSCLCNKFQLYKNHRLWPARHMWFARAEPPAQSFPAALLPFVSQTDGGNTAGRSLTEQRATSAARAAHASLANNKRGLIFLTRAFVISLFDCCSESATNACLQNRVTKNDSASAGLSRLAANWRD